VIGEGGEDDELVFYEVDAGCVLAALENDQRGRRVAHAQPRRA
jgi:hypothetical protein